MSPFKARAAGARLERMRASPLFVDGAFSNPAAISTGLKPGTALSTIGEYFGGGQRRRPPAALPAANPLDRWRHPPASGLRATWLGHSTVLLEIDGHRVLTDPVWSDRASPYSFAGPRRFQPVPVPLSSLPPLDAVVISHDHYDHLDHATIRALVPLGVPFYTSLGVGAHLAAWGVPAERIVELDWWESARAAGGALTLTAAPAQHFSGRGVTGKNSTLWSSFTLRGEAHAVFFSGDTGLTPEYAAIRDRLGPFDLTLLEVGAFHPSWGDIHLGPEHALDAHVLLGGGALLPVHWGTFNLAIHAWDEPAETLVQLAPARGVQLVMPRLGDPVEPAHAERQGERIDAWWRAVGGGAGELVSSPQRSPSSPSSPVGEERDPSLPLPAIGAPID